MEQVELDEVQWRAPEWIRAYGLRTDNVLDYFALSPFYDRSSNNQVLRMQSAFNEQLQTRTDLQNELVKMKGIEFVLAIANEPDLWVIRKQERSSPSDAKILATYYVVGDNIYQAPTTYSVLSSRIFAISLYMGKALDNVQDLLSFNSKGYLYTDKAETADATMRTYDRVDYNRHDVTTLKRALALSLKTNESAS